MTATIPEMFGHETAVSVSSAGWTPAPKDLVEEPRTALEAALVSMPVPMDEVLKRLSEANLQPSAIETVRGLIAAIRSASDDVTVTVAETADGGATVEVESARNEREVTYAVPADGSRRYFSVTERGEVRLTGAISLDLAIANLVRWVHGDSDQPSTVGLLLPSRLRGQLGR